MKRHRILMVIGIVFWHIAWVFPLYGCPTIGKNQIRIVFPPNTGIDITAFEKLCTSNSCHLRDPYTILYQSHYDPHALIVTGPYEVKDGVIQNELWTVSLVIPRSERDDNGHDIYPLDIEQFDWATALVSELRLLVVNQILIGIPEEDLAHIAVVATRAHELYWKPRGCGDSYSSAIISDDGQYGWVAGHGILLLYKNDCPLRIIVRCLGGLDVSVSDIPPMPLQIEIPAKTK